MSVISPQAARSSLKGEGVQPFATDESLGMAVDRRRLADVKPQSAVLLPPDVGVWRFRTHADKERRSFQIPLRIPHMMPDSPEWPRAFGVYQGFVTRLLRQKKVTMAELNNKNELLFKSDLAVRDELGAFKIKFQRVRGVNECIYQTRNPVVADYIRERINKGDFPEIYEEVRNLILVVGDEKVEMGAIGADSQAALARILATIGLEGVEVKMS